MQIQRTEDATFIKAVFDEPSCRPWMRDDGTPEDWSPSIHPMMYYLVPSIETHDEGLVNEHAIGVILFSPVNFCTWNPHIAILPRYRGRGTEAMTEAIRWMFRLLGITKDDALALMDGSARVVPRSRTAKDIVGVTADADDRECLELMKKLTRQA